MPRFFIGRPIFAIVLAILMTLAGLLSIVSLPIEQYPTIAPPGIQVTASYPGASAETVESTVVQVIEQQMSGLDNLLYLSSTSDDTGNGTTTLTFSLRTNPDIAQVQVQNKLQLALPQLPTQVQQTGVRVTKSSTGFLLVAGFVSADNSMSAVDIANFIASRIQDPLGRINGVGNLTLFGTQYAMRIWLDANRLNSFGLTPIDVSSAISSQNIQVAGGRLGGLPAPATQQLTAAITETSLLNTPEQFGNILLKVSADGAQVRIRDVARVQLGAEDYSTSSRYNGQPSAAIAVQLAPGANALDTANAVRATIDGLKPYFPPGLQVVYPYDITPFIETSITEVVKALFVAIALVFLVMFLFLQNLRATLIPTLAVPVVLLGTFGIMAAAGFTINTLTMFGLVLAIGLLVDDAIVVVENVSRVMTEEKLSAREATQKAMTEVTGALLGVAVVLSAVFVPVAFTAGAVGAIYRQFSLTIVAAMLLSVFVALSLTPALCSLMLKPEGEASAEQKRRLLARLRRGFFGPFNRGFELLRNRYLSGARGVMDRFGRWLLIYAAVIVAVVLLYLRLPSGFVPSEDQGVAFIQVQTPPGSTQGTTAEILEEVAGYLRQQEAAAVDATLEISGFSFLGRGQTQGMVFVRLKDWSVRKRADLSVQAVLGRLARHFATFQGALIIPINPPAIPGLGTASGFDLFLQDRAGLGHDQLTQARNQFLGMAQQDRTLGLVYPNTLQQNPTYQIDIDRAKASAFGLSLSDVDQTFSIAWASRYVNNFLDTDGRIKRVFLQADAPFRMNPEDLRSLYVRNSQGSMVEFTSFARGKWDWGSPQLQRYNGVPAVEIQGQPAPGKSTGQAMAAIQALATRLPAGVGYSWTGLSLQEQQAGSQAVLFYALSVLVVFLCLAALYESWTVPISVIMVVPLGLIGALAAAMALRLQNDVFFQVSLLVTLGLSAKNAILIVEFARDLEAGGKTATAASLEAARLRLRPILMTSLAFVIGVAPLAIASGAGSEGRQEVGRGVVGGMLTGTFLVPLLVPMFFLVITEKVFKSRRAKADASGVPRKGPRQ
jgi:multidrug efflux pump